MYNKITGEDPYKTPMRIYPAVHYTMGGLWVDYDLMTTVPGLYAIGECNFSDHGANRLGASALMQGLADGYFILPYTIGTYLSKEINSEQISTNDSAFDETLQSSKDIVDKLLSNNGNKTVESLHKELGLIPLDPSYRLIFGEGGSIDATSNLDLMTERIEELCGKKNAKGFEKYVLENREKLNRSRNCLNTPWTGFSNLISKRAFRVARILKPWRSVASDLARIFPDKRMQLAMSFQTKYLGMSPFHAPSLFTILAYLEYEHGIFHAKGGLGSITKNMARIAKDLGVNIKLNSAVDEIIFDGKTAIGVISDNKKYLSQLLDYFYVPLRHQKT